MESEAVPSQFKAPQEVDIYNDSFSEDSFQIEDDINELHSASHSASPETLNKTGIESSPMLGGGISSKKTSELTVIKQVAPAVSRMPVNVRTHEVDVEDSDASEDISSEEEDDLSDGGSHKSHKSSRSTASETSSTSTTSLLANDPLFIVLSQYLSNKDGNIVDALYKINKTLKKIYAKMP
jgi:hypothetical protein